MDTLPPLQMAWVQKKTAYLLAGVYYTQLGQYEPEHFVDARVKSPLQKFKNTLEVIFKFFFVVLLIEVLV